MKKHLAKGFTTALLVAVLMAVFAVSASAADPIEVGDETALRNAVKNAEKGTETVIVVTKDIVITEPIATTASTDDNSRKVIIIKSATDENVKITAADAFAGDRMFTTTNYTSIKFVNITLNANVWVKGQNGEYAKRDNTVNTLRCLYSVGYRAYFYLEGNTIVTGGYAENGGAAFLYGRVYMNQASTLEEPNKIEGSAKIIGNKATGNGGGVYMSNDTAWQYLYMYGDSVITENEAQNGGGVYGNCNSDSAKSNTILAGNATISNNTATSAGGGIYHKGTIKMLDNSSVSNNKAGTGSGGGILINSGTFSMAENASVSDNQAGYNGGGICDWADGDTTLSGGTISGNTAGEFGGGLYHSAGTAALNGVVISGNKAEDYGGGIYNSAGKINFSAGSVKGNTAGTKNKGDGGGVYNKATFNMSGTAYISGNSVTNANLGGSAVMNRGAAAVFNMTGGLIGEHKDFDGSSANIGESAAVQNYGTMTISSGYICGNKNTSSGYGAAIKNAIDTYVDPNVVGKLTISGGEISGNTNTNGSGGAIYNYATLIMDGGTISGNTAGYGGAVYLKTGTFTMSGGTITANDSSKGAGGVYVDANCTFAISGGSISDNVATNYAGGVYVADYENTYFNVSGTATVTDNWLGEDEETRVACNVQFDDYLNYPERITVTADHTGKIGVYFKTLTVESGEAVVIGTAEDDVTSVNITNDNANGFKAITAPADGKLQFGTEYITVTFKNLQDKEVSYKIAAAEGIGYLLPATATSAITTELGIVGQFIGYTDGENFYEDEVILTKNEIAGKTFTVAALDIETVEGASIRLSGTGGIRFFTKVDTAALDKLVELGFSYKRGAVVKADSAAAFEQGNENTVSGYADTEYVSSAASSLDWKGSLYDEFADLPDGEKVYAIGLNMDEDLYAQKLSFRGYVTLKLGDSEITVYSDYNAGDHTRSAADVADSYLSENSDWTEESHGQLTDAQYLMLCTIAEANDAAAE